jgi:hypothetical protein
MAKAAFNKKTTFHKQLGHNLRKKILTATFGA